MLSLLPAALCAVLATFAGQFGPRRLYLWSKPLPLLLLLVAVLLTPDVPAKPLLLTALLCAWLGDIALLFPARGFVLGLLAFLLGHLTMIGALLTLGAQFSLWPTILAVLSALVFTYLLWPRQKLLRGAVLLYGLVLALMVALIVPFTLSMPTWWGLLPAAVLFAFSDSVLGWNKFRRPIGHPQLWILTSYFSAQLLFAHSFLNVTS